METVLRLGDDTYITPTEAKMRVRGGGFGAGAWLAQIIATDPKFGFAREFIRKNTSDLSGSGKSGTISWEIENSGIYEWRGFCVGSTPRNWESSGFCKITDEGIEELSKKEVLNHLEGATV